MPLKIITNMLKKVLFSDDKNTQQVQTSNLQRKLESSETYFAEVRNKSSKDFEVINIFGKYAILIYADI